VYVREFDPGTGGNAKEGCFLQGREHFAREKVQEIQPAGAGTKGSYS